MFVSAVFSRLPASDNEIRDCGRLEEGQIWVKGHVAPLADRC